MKCPKCNTELQTQTEKCPNCGTTLVQSATNNKQTIGQYILLREFKRYAYATAGFAGLLLTVTNYLIIFPIRNPKTYEPNMLFPILFLSLFLCFTAGFFVSYRNFLFLKTTGKIYCSYCRRVSDVQSDFCVNCKTRAAPWRKHYCEEDEYNYHQRQQQAISPAPVDRSSTSTLEVKSPYDYSSPNLPSQQHMEQLCPTCGQRVGFVPQYQKYYCYYCRQYLAE